MVPFLKDELKVTGNPVLSFPYAVLAQLLTQPKRSLCLFDIK